MNNTQKLQILTGVATPIAFIVYICLGIAPIISAILFRSRSDSPSEDWTFLIIGTIFLLIIFVCSLMVAFGACGNATGSSMGFDMLCVAGLIITVLLGIWAFIVTILGGGIYGLLAFAPVILSVITILLGLSTKSKDDILHVIESKF